MENNQTEKTSRSINYYAASGTALLVSLITVVFIIATSILLGAMTSSTQSYSDWSNIMMPVLVSFYILAILGIAIVIPILRNARYGWQTILATIMIEFVLLFILALATTWAGSLFTSDDSCGYANNQTDFSSSITEGVSAQRCYYN